MKLKKPILIGGIGVIAVLIAIATITAVLLIKQEETPLGQTEAISITDDCWENVTNLNAVELDDGTVEVTLTAPDYVSLIKLLESENNDAVTGKHFTKAMKNNPEAVKEYTFTAASSSETDIKNALMEQISYELVALTLEDMIGE